MAKIFHAVSLISGSDTLAAEDRLHVGKYTVAYAAGASAGASSAAAVSAEIPPGALFVAGAVSGASVAVAQTATGFTVTVTPASGTLAAGSVGVLVIA